MRAPIAILVLLVAGCASSSHPISRPADAAETNKIATATPAPAKVSQFRGEYEFLSNFYPAIVEFEGITYPTVEHAYQSAKTNDMAERRRIAAIDKPGDAKKAGRALKYRDDWEQVKFDVMEQCVRYKFTHHPELRAKLLATGDATLEEGNTWGDTIWGAVDGKGDNRLGNLLMKVRGELHQMSGNAR